METPSTAKPLDPRRHAARPDLADAALQGRVTAERFVSGRPALTTAPSAPMWSGPTPGGARTATLLKGEPVKIFDEGTTIGADGVATTWRWVQSEWDGYVGYAPADAFDPDPSNTPAPTHAVSALFAHVYDAANMKAEPRATWPINARCALAEVPDQGFAPLVGGGWIHVGQVRALETPARDWVAIAAGFVGAPYLWGGKTADGIDCSGLVQAALQAADQTCPRDSDMQAAELGAPIDVAGPLRRGDLVFWRGHVAIMVDPQNVVHASSWWMRCLKEPLDVVRARLVELGDGAPIGARRLTMP